MWRTKVARKQRSQRRNQRVRDRRRDKEREGEKRIKKRVVTKLTIHTRPRAPGVPGNGANDMPGPQPGEWNLSGILGRFRRIRNSEDGCSPRGSLLLSGSSRVSRISADSIKRSWWNALWETLLPFLSLFSSPSSPCVSFLHLSLSVSLFLLCRYSSLLPRQRHRFGLRFISANEPFRDEPPAHPRMGTI